MLITAQKKIDKFSSMYSEMIQNTQETLSTHPDLCQEIIHKYLERHQWVLGILSIKFII